MNRRKAELYKIKDYYNYLKTFGYQLEDIDLMIKYCDQMVKNTNIPLKFVMDRQTDYEYYYSILNANFSGKVDNFKQWLKKS